MASEVKVFQVTIPHGTLASAPATTPITLGTRTVSRIDVRVPPGPRGEVGFRFATGGVGVIPDNSGAWIITDNETLTFALTGLHDTGAWQVIGYNTGTYDHTIYVTFFLDPVDAQQPANPSVIPMMVGQEIA